MGFESLSGISSRILRFSNHRTLRYTLLVFSMFVWTVLCLAEPCLAQEGESKPKQVNTLLWLLHVSGPIGVLIFALSVYFVAVAFKQFMDLRMSVAAPPEVLELTTKLIEEKNAKGLIALRAEMFAVQVPVSN